MARNNSINQTSTRFGVNTSSSSNGNTFNINGSVGTKFTRVSNTITLDNTHHTILSTGTLTINLPEASTAEGREYTIIKTDDNTTVTIDAYSNETINGNLTFILSFKSSCILKCDGLTWFVMNLSSFNFKTYSITNYSDDREMDVSATNIDEIANVLATLISDLKNNKII